ncbi:uncharacterized protein TNCV_1506491 [Trichonephila clavipes]|nr:uncharacterized protein TNCV_1506491 [Trichonephila clavipes]
MALAAPSSSVASTSASCLPPQLPLISLRETVAKINMPAVVQSPAVNSQISLSSTTVSNEPVYNLTFSNGEIINTASTSTVPKIAVPSVTALAGICFGDEPVIKFKQKIKINRFIILFKISKIFNNKLLILGEKSLGINNNWIPMRYGVKTSLVEEVRDRPQVGRTFHRHSLHFFFQYDPSWPIPP